SLPRNWTASLASTSPTAGTAAGSSQLPQPVKSCARNSVTPGSIRSKSSSDTSTTFERDVSMPLLFAYKQVRIRRPAVALGGRTTRPRPLVQVTLLGPSSVYLAEALLDPGAD